MSSTDENTHPVDEDLLIRGLVRAMHDSLCRCGGWCSGAERDLWGFAGWVEQYWGSTVPLESFLRELRDR